MNHSMHDDRLLELLADREVESLSDADRHELDALLAETPDADDGSMEQAAVMAMLGSLGVADEMPAELRRSTLAAIEVSDTSTSGTTPVPAAAEAPLRIAGTPADAPAPRVSVIAWSGWIAAAACLVVAGLTVLNSPRPLPPTEARSRFLQTASDVAVANWGDWDNPEQPGVTGTIEWSESAQKGYMTFEGLAVNNPTVEQYQLWIIDERGMEQRISGAIFDADSEGRVVVEVDPAIEVHNAAMFAVTIEKPEGVWNSDMSRRVVIAELKS
ncbi:MAG: anti-sigma factor [Planctomycetota bacterium]|nr:MAG: anti-sigma factor [Planctomycetota bacterium]